MQNTSQTGARIYTPLTLKLYDWWVLNLSNRYAWQCPTRRYLLPHFISNSGEQHLDIGSGSGYYLPHLPQHCRIYLADLNPSSLRAATARAGQARIAGTLMQDIYQPFPANWQNKFDSVSMFYLLHCLPGSMADKHSAIKHAAMSLKPGGKLAGATILGQGVCHNAFGRKLMALYNKKGIFSNEQDSADQLRQILARYFQQVNIQVTGTVALFDAR